MASKAKKHIKKKDEPNQPGPKYRTPSRISPDNKFTKPPQQSKFGSDNLPKGKAPNIKFNPAKFKVQHKG